MYVTISLIGVIVIQTGVLLYCHWKQHYRRKGRRNRRGQVIQCLRRRMDSRKDDLKQSQNVPDIVKSTLYRHSLLPEADHHKIRMTSFRYFQPSRQHGGRRRERGSGSGDGDNYLEEQQIKLR